MIGTGLGLAPLAIRSPAQLREEEERVKRERLDADHEPPVLSGLSAHVQERWYEAKTWKEPVARRMRASLNQRRGVYDPDKLQKIRAGGGSEVYAMITSVKCRAAAAWLRDALSGAGSSKPWSVQPTPMPDLPADLKLRALVTVQAQLRQLLAMGVQPTPEIGAQIKQVAEDALRNEANAIAREMAKRTETRMEDALEEGGFQEAFSAFLDDLVTFPAAFIRGPVVRRKVALEWGPEGATPVERLVLEFDRVSPFDIYPAPWATSTDDGYLIQRHRLTRSRLAELIGVPGYSETEIRKCLEEFDAGGNGNWTQLGLEGEAVSQDYRVAKGLIDALELWDDIPGRLLVEWGMPREQVPDLDKEYSANVWFIRDRVIRAVLNADPLGLRGYSMASYERIPGEFWGLAIPDLIRDVQDSCNAAMRALINNMGIASGPQVAVNTERLAEGEKLTSMTPWKIWQFVSDPMGSSAPAVDFFSPPSNAAELSAVYESHSALADEYSGIPRYLSGGEAPGGAGRTASGLSMMIGNASKLIKQVVANVDSMMESLLKKLHLQLLYHMRDPEVAGDIDIVVNGSSAILARDTVQLRRNEFLQMTANPYDLQIIGLEGRAALLRETAKDLGINPDQVVPSPDVMKLKAQAQQALAQQGPQSAAGASEPQPGPTETTPGMAPELAAQGGRPAASMFDRPPVA